MYGASMLLSNDATISIASASDLVVSKSEGSLSFQQASSEGANKSGNCASAFDCESKTPASRSSFAVLQMVMIEFRVVDISAF